MAHLKQMLRPLDPIWGLMKTSTVFSLSLVVFIAFLFVIPEGFIAPDLGETILTISTFLLGLIAGFYIIVTTTDYNSIKNILAAETGGWIALYEHVRIYDARIAEKLSALLDQYILHAFDYEIIDYARGTSEEFEEIRKCLSGLSLDENRESFYSEIRSTMGGIIMARQ